MNNVKEQLSLVVLNSEQLDGHYQVQHGFTEQGGTLGAAEQDDWQLRDRLGAVLPAHARIEWLDGHFCLLDLSGQTFINGATAPIGRGRRVQLAQGDELGIGPYRLRTYLGERQAERRLEQVLGHEDEGDLVQWLSRAPDEAEPVSVPDRRDPLWALQQEQGCLQTMPISASAVLDRQPTSLCQEDTMEQEFIDIPAIRPTATAGLAESEHLALAPLMRGLGQPLPLADSQQAHDMLEEMGRTLKAMVEGLLTLQAEQAALADKHLRPIEDNPLRLGLDYGNTLGLLFADGKSPVHLSAPAAVGEVLRNVRIHHQANQQAIASALQSILQAFSPAALEQRFMHYRRSGEGAPTDDGWAWQMYRHYYQELTSLRQQGFDKLFHQVYAQAYDKAVRERQGAC